MHGGRLLSARIYNSGQALQAVRRPLKVQDKEGRCRHEGGNQAHRQNYADCFRDAIHDFHQRPTALDVLLLTFVSDRCCCDGHHKTGESELIKTEGWNLGAAVRARPSVIRAAAYPTTRLSLAPLRRLAPAPPATQIRRLRPKPSQPPRTLNPGANVLNAGKARYALNFASGTVSFDLPIVIGYAFGLECTFMGTYFELCFERAEAAEANAEKTQDAEAKRLWRTVAGKWREIAQNLTRTLSHDEWAASRSPGGSQNVPSDCGP